MQFSSSMIYLSCVIVSRWCNQVGIQSIFKMFRLGEFRVCSGSSFQSWTAEKARKMHIKDEYSYVMLVDLKNYVKGLLTHFQQ